MCLFALCVGSMIITLHVHAQSIQSGEQPICLSVCQSVQKIVKCASSRLAKAFRGLVNNECTLQDVNISYLVQGSSRQFLRILSYLLLLVYLVHHF